jgi:hypothetical protein
MLDDPEAFYDTVRNLEQMAEDHLCFYGTGHDDGACSACPAHS